MTLSAECPVVPLASKRHTFRFLLIVGGVACAGLLQARSAGAAPIAHFPLYFSIIFFQFLFVWFVKRGIRGEGGNLRSLIGRSWNNTLAAVIDLSLAIALVIALRASTLLWRFAFGPALARTAFLLPSGSIECALWVVVSITAGWCEELVYRGYLQRQLYFFTGNIALAIVVQAVIFGVAHIYQGWRAAVITSCYGLAFGLVAAWRRSIIPCAIAHSLIDILGGLLPR